MPQAQGVEFEFLEDPRRTKGAKSTRAEAGRRPALLRRMVTRFPPRFGMQNEGTTERVIATRDHLGMNPLLLIIILLLVFGGGGFYMGGPAYGGSGIGLILLICLIIFLVGGFRGKR